MQCPINSRTTSEGAMNCVCRNGYYRTDSDPLQMPCTSTYWSINYRMHFSQTWMWSDKAFPLILFILYLTYCISHAWVGEAWDQRTVVVSVWAEKEEACQGCLFHRHDTDMPIVLLSIAVTQYTKMAAPPQDHTGRTARWRRGYWARASGFVEGQPLRISLGKTISCHANEAEFEFEFEASTEVEWDTEGQTKANVRAGGVKCVGNTCRKERSRENLIESERLLSLCEEDGGLLHRVWSH